MTDTMHDLDPYVERPLLQIQGLSVTYRGRRRGPIVRAVDGVSFTVGQGETLAVVGESGSGKSTIAKAILGLVAPTSGSITFQGRDLATVSSKDRRALGRDIQAVFQDPQASLNPSYPIGRSIAEPLTVGPAISRPERESRVEAMLAEVGLGADAALRRPAGFSGGQRQRISIARALISRPRLVICDEAVSALDLSVQAQILNLLARLQTEFGVGYLFISHDLAVVRRHAQRVIVLYRGQVMESGPTPAVVDAPGHPYTAALLAAAPVADPLVQRKRHVDTEADKAAAVLPPTSAATSQGCPFAGRCDFVQERCRQERPALRQLADGREIACHRLGEWQQQQQKHQGTR